MALGSRTRQAAAGPWPIEGSNFTIDCDVVIPGHRPAAGARLDRAGPGHPQVAPRDDHHQRRAHDRPPGRVRRRRRADGHADRHRVRRPGQARGEGDRPVSRRCGHGRGRRGARRRGAGPGAHRHRPVQARGAAGPQCRSSRSSSACASFELIEGGTTRAAAEKEAGRCLQCVCPDVGRCPPAAALTRARPHREQVPPRRACGLPRLRVRLQPRFILRDQQVHQLHAVACASAATSSVRNCYGLMGAGYDSIVTTPWNVSLQYTDCVSCGACVETCPPAR